MSSNRRRLVAGSSSRRAQSSRSNQSVGSISLDLPPYEPPTCPLNDDGKQALRELSNTRINDQLKKHLNESAKLLATAVYDTLDTVADRKRQAANTTEKDTERKEDATRKAQELEQKVSPLTIQLENSMREVLDMEAALQDQKQTLQDLPRLIAQAQQTLREQYQQENEEDDADSPEIAGVPIMSLYETERDKKSALYSKLDMRAKYAQHNSYIDFRRSWHDGVSFDQERPVPDPSTWFDEDGRPQYMDRGDDADDDIQIASEKRSFRCPLSLVEMTEPYTCRRCGHSFQKTHILKYLNVDKGGAPAPCPEAGCEITVSLHYYFVTCKFRAAILITMVQDMTANDFFANGPLLGQIKRSRQIQREADSSDVDVEGEEEGGQVEDEGEDEMDMDSDVRPKAERE